MDVAIVAIDVAICSVHGVIVSLDAAICRVHGASGFDGTDVSFDDAIVCIDTAIFRIDGIIVSRCLTRHIRGSAATRRILIGYPFASMAQLSLDASLDIYAEVLPLGGYLSGTARDRIDIVGAASYLRHVKFAHLRHVKFYA